MKQRFTFFLDPELKKRTKKYAENHTPPLSVAQVIHKSLIKLLGHDRDNL